MLLQPHLLLSQFYFYFSKGISFWHASYLSTGEAPSAGKWCSQEALWQPGQRLAVPRAFWSSGVLGETNALRGLP